MDEIKQTAGVLDRQLSDVLATDPLSALTAVTSIRNLIAERERQAVTAAVADHTWREIGVALGVLETGGLSAIWQGLGGRDEAPDVQA